MSSAKNDRCPICNKNYLPTETTCKKCGWDLTLERNSYVSTEKILAQTQTATKAVYNKVRARMTRYRNERNELRSKMDEIGDLPQQVFELQLRVSELEKETQLSSVQLQNIEQLKQEIILEVENRFRGIITRQNSLQITNTPSNKSIENISSEYDCLLQENVNNDENEPQIKQPEIKKQLENDRLQTDNDEEIGIIRQYYQNPKGLVQYACKVTPTKKTLEDIYINRVNEVIFEVSNRSEYWIFKLSSGNYCLLPEFNFKINTNIKTLRTIFDLQEYKDNIYKQFQVLKPARVKEKEARTWQLTERGILQF